ncbi:hypothetical protein [Williamsoniiplasma lucivorax]|uniref:Uncharacterized protein n=1 Tax=Williamsoniiplasma lucivorax TaxID=209274 RepID=A0A2S5R9G1_9MOLU|nr:hypothetical protein [Williamsoniiplasma lucivorax]PPE03954.1 hypothetical protein ELUCI_v1c09600 [Williamsoniiplasma lucivorax]
MSKTIDFKMIKKTNNKVALWMGATTFFMLIIVLVIIVSLPTITKKQQIIISLELLVNCLLILVTLFLIGISQIITSLFYHQVAYKEAGTNKVVREVFEINKMAHLYIIGFLVLFSGMQIVTMGLIGHTFTDLLKTYWWLIVGCFVWNTFIIYLSFGFKTYMYNNLIKK